MRVITFVDKDIIVKFKTICNINITKYKLLNSVNLINHNNSNK